MKQHLERVTLLDEEINRIIVEMCRKVPAAADWLLSVAEVATHWDHIVDDDPLDKARFDGCMFAMSVGWGLNEFYRTHAPILSIVSLNAILGWKSSDTDSRLRCKAYDCVTELGTTVALLVGGPAHAIEWSLKLRSWAHRKQIDNDKSQQPEVPAQAAEGS